MPLGTSIAAGTAGGLSTVLFVVSVTDLTTQAGWMVGLAIVALLATGWRKTARATAQTPRREPVVRKKWVPIGIAETTVSLYNRPNVIRRVWAVAASSAIAVVMGAVLAIVMAFGLAFAVITLTDLLKQ
jgi:nicotinamidase-related amidase